MKTTLFYTPELKASLRREKLRKKELKRKTKGVSQQMHIMESSQLFEIAAGCVLFGLICAIMVIGISLMYSKELRGLQFQVAQLEQEKHELSLAKTELEMERDSLTFVLQEVSKVAYKVDQSNLKLIETIDELNDDIAAYEEREELFDEYEWALRKKDGTRTDITYANIIMLHELAEEEGLTGDVADLVLSIAVTEAKGDETAQNANSTASGHGQFLENTGRFVYETVMGNGKGTYTHNMALDGELNLQMMTYYLGYLGDKYKGNVYLSVNEYRGYYDAKWEASVNEHLASVGKNLDMINFRP